MAQVCDMCGKSPKFGKSVSRSHVRTNRRWTPNIQTVRALRNAATKRLRVYTSCIKAGGCRDTASWYRRGTVTGTTPFSPKAMT